jgi:peptidoglycan/LPS O-acetylase OafA/YrhL
MPIEDAMGAEAPVQQTLAWSRLINTVQGKGNTAQPAEQAATAAALEVESLLDGQPPRSLRRPHSLPAAAEGATGNTSTRRFRPLDGLRGVAAIVVVIHHALMVLPSLASPHFSGVPVRPSYSWPWLAAHTPIHWLWSGREAVWVFFVLSGFVLTRAMMRTSRRSWLSYYPSRLIRLYVPVVVAVLAAAAFIKLRAEPPVTGFGDWMHHRPDVSMRGAALDSTTMANIVGPLRPLWSLRWEVLFSLLLPVFYWGTLVWRRGVIVKLAGLLLLVYIGTIASASPLVYLPMFAVGALLAQELDRFANLADRVDLGHGDLRWWALTVASLTLLTSTWLIMPLSPAWRIGALSQPAGLAGAAGLVYVALFWRRARRLLERRSIQWLGAVSFSLYLVHEPIAVAFGFMVGERRGLLAIPFTIATSLAVAAGFRWFVERPSHNIARRVGKWIDRKSPNEQCAAPIEETGAQQTLWSSA